MVMFSWGRSGQAAILFHQDGLDRDFERRSRAAREELNQLSDRQLLNVNPTELADYLFQKHAAREVIFDWDNKNAEKCERDVDVSQERGRDIRDRGRPFYIKQTFIVVSTPVEGDLDLVQYRPSRFFNVFPSASLSGQEVHFEVQADRTPQEVRQAIDHEIGLLSRYAENLNRDIKESREALKRELPNWIAHRTAKVRKETDLLSELGIPLRRRQDLPETFVVPQTKRRVQPQFPALQPGLPPEPTLQAAEYEHILRIIGDMVRTMERSPNTFAHLGEDQLRDFLLVQLNGHYEGKATGETFNNRGKTDILIPHDGKNLFIAECKIWGGPEKMKQAVRQILDYVTWRDTKTALVIFNKNVDFSNVLASIQVTIEACPGWVRTLGRPEDTQFRFVFRRPNDSARELQLTVICFDIPRDPSQDAPTRRKRSRS